MSSRILLAASLFAVSFWLLGLIGEILSSSEIGGLVSGVVGGVVSALVSWQRLLRSRAPTYSVKRVTISAALGFLALAVLTFLAVGFASRDSLAALLLALWLPLLAIPACVVLGCAYWPRQGVL